jgi:hypothetical protein
MTNAGVVLIGQQANIGVVMGIQIQRRCEKHDVCRRHISWNYYNDNIKIFVDKGLKP